MRWDDRFTAGLLSAAAAYFLVAAVKPSLSAWMVPKQIRDEQPIEALHSGYRWFLTFVGLALLSVVGVLLFSKWPR
jgi:hypothetical protein